MASDRPGRLTTGGGAPLVLIVEDEQPIAEALRDIVEDQGYQTVTARDGQEGLELAREYHPALIITDLMMPRMDGVAFIGAMRIDAAREGWSAPPVILTSAVDGNSAIENVSPDAFLLKPFHIGYLERLLDRFLKGRG